MVSPQEYKLNRRRTLQAGAWSAPLLLASSLVPTYAASQEPGQLTATYSLFAQMINSRLETPLDTYAGVHSHQGTVADPSATVQYAQGRVTGSNGLAAHGEGTFTPGGTVGQNGYGGMGFWASAPYDSSTGQPVDASRTLLAAGSTFEVTYRFTFTEEEALLDPLTWVSGGEETYPAIADNPTDRLTHRNGAAIRVQMLEPQSEGRVWTGRLLVTLTQDLSITHGEGQKNLGQILASHHAVYYDMAEFLEEGEVTIKAADDARLVLTAPDYDSVVIPLAGQQISTSLPFQSSTS